MKIYLDQTELFEINQTRLGVFCSEINEDNLIAYLREKLMAGFGQQYAWSFARFKAEWDTKLLQEGATSIPLDPDAYAQAIFARPDYKTAKQKDIESMASPVQQPETPSGEQTGPVPEDTGEHP